MPGYHLYDKDGNQSRNLYSADELKKLKITRKTMVHPENGKRVRAVKVEELAAAFGWNGSFFSREIILLLLAITTVGVLVLMKSAQAASCLKEQARIDKRMEDLQVVNSGLKERIGELKKETEDFKAQLQLAKIKEINLNDKLPGLENQKIQILNDRQKAGDQICLTEACVTKKQQAIDEYNEALNTCEVMITSYKNEIQEIREILVPGLEREISSRKEKIESHNSKITDYQGRIDELVARRPDCGQRGLGL